jgi:hypothetical protein
MSFVKFALRFFFGSMFVTILTVPVSAQSMSLAERQARAGNFWDPTRRTLERAIAGGMGMMPSSSWGGMGYSSFDFSIPAPPARPAPPLETEPSIPDAKKREIYDRYLRVMQDYQETVDKFPNDRKDHYLKINSRRVQIDLGQKYALTQPEMQWIVNHGKGLEPIDASGKKNISIEERKLLALEETKKVIFKDWARKRRTSLGNAAKISRQSRAEAYRQLEDKRLVKELTAKYHITPAELDQIKTLGTTKNW